MWRERGVALPYWRPAHRKHTERELPSFSVGHACLSFSLSQCVIVVVIVLYIGEGEGTKEKKKRRRGGDLFVLPFLLLLLFVGMCEVFFSSSVLPIFFHNKQELQGVAGKRERDIIKGKAKNECTFR